MTSITRLTARSTRSSRLVAIVILLAMLSLGLEVSAQGFSSGSDGSFGSIEVLEGIVVLPLPDDGIFRATTVTVSEGAILTFQRNALNTPVHILATGDITVAGTIDVNARPGTAKAGGIAGPGGFDGGAPGLLGFPGGWGHGPGGTAAANDAADVIASAHGTVGNFGSSGVYGSALLMPLAGGSGAGGAPGIGGGAGGGAILLSSDSRIVVSGAILARGSLGSGVGNFGFQLGSGGSIRLVAPRVEGAGTLDVLGGHAYIGTRRGGAGRIRIDTTIRDGIEFAGLDSISVSGYTIPQPTSIGAFMKVFLDVEPRLDLTEVAGQEIPEGTTDAVAISLPFGANPNQPVKLRARGLDGDVPIAIVLIPESGERVVRDAVITLPAGKSAELTVNVDFPINTRTHVYVWTR